MQVTIAATGRFHFVDLAQQLQRLNSLCAYFTAYPTWKINPDHRIDPKKIVSFPWIHTAYMGSIRKKWLPDFVYREVEIWDRRFFDKKVSQSLELCDIFTAISSCGVTSGSTAKRLGAKYVCDRGSSHILAQDRLLRDEHLRWGIDYQGIDKRIIDRELEEYRNSDLITVPSEFSRKTFVQEGISQEKIITIPYGVNLDDFFPTSEPEPDQFNVVFVGGATLRKGLPYLFDAFKQASIKNKRLHLIGHLDPSLFKSLSNRNLIPDETKIWGHIGHHELRNHLSKADVLVLPSIEDGFGLVMAQAMACGCPVIATEHTGAAELIDHGLNGFIIKPGDAKQLKRALESLAFDAPKQDFRSAAVRKVSNLGGWNDYGDRIASAYQRLLAA